MVWCFLDFPVALVMHREKTAEKEKGEAIVASFTELFHANQIQI
jgi:hypothetical protein